MYTTYPSISKFVGPPVKISSGLKLICDKGFMLPLIGLAIIHLCMIVNLLYFKFIGLMFLLFLLLCHFYSCYMSKNFIALYLGRAVKDGFVDYADMKCLRDDGGFECGVHVHCFHIEKGRKESSRVTKCRHNVSY